jgi:hypothetical protein
MPAAMPIRLSRTWKNVSGVIPRIIWRPLEHRLDELPILQLNERQGNSLNG